LLDQINEMHGCVAIFTKPFVPFEKMMTRMESLDLTDILNGAIS